MIEGASRYRITRLIQRGGMAEVYEAQILGDGGFSRQVAIKRLLPEYAADPGFVRAFVGEAKLVSQLQHANLVSVFDFGTMDGLPFQVLELVNGLDCERLDAHADDYGKSLPPELWLAVISEAAHGLDYAHHAREGQGRPLGIVHRDVSPSNVLVAWQGGVKIGDFGIAHSFEARDATRVGVVKGKLAYMAPEQVEGSGVDPRTDVFALGCVLHRMIAGASPLETEEDRRRFVSGARATISPLLPPDVAKIVARAVEPDPARRFPSAAHLAAECARAASNKTGTDARSIVRDWMERLRPTEERPINAAMFGTPMNVEVVLAGTGEENVRRFASQVRKAELIETRALPPPQRSPISRPGAAGRTPVSMQSGASAPSGLVSGSGDPLINSVIGEYQVLEMIGKGGFARVYRARHLVFHSEFALKVLLESYKDSPGAQRRFQREALALHAVSHPNLVAIEDSGVTPDGRPYIVMEMVHGETLREALVASAGPFGLHRTRRLARQIALALSEAHRQGFVHRDLKPKNIVLMRTPDGEEAKVLDFGLALLLDPKSELTRLTSAGHYLGTARWMAPEQVVNAAQVGPAADLYCLGLILFAMSVGQPPFRGTPEEVMRKHREDVPEIPAVAGPFAPLIRQLLEKEPTRRPESAAKVAEALTALDLGFEPEPQEPTRLETRATEAGVALQTRILSEPQATAMLSAVPSPAPRDASEGAPMVVPVIAGPTVSRSGMVVIAASALVLAAGGGFMLALWTQREPAVPVVMAPPTRAPEPSPEPPAPVAARAPAAVQATPAPSPSDDPTSVSTAGAPAAPARNPRAELDALRASWESKIAAELARKSLSKADLELDASTRAARAAFTAARDARAIERAGPALVQAIQAFELDREALRARLDALRGGLGKAVDAHGPAAVGPLERRYLDARSALSSGKSALEIARQIRELERDLAALGP